MLPLYLSNLCLQIGFHLLLLTKGHFLQVFVTSYVRCYSPVLLVYHVNLVVQHVDIVVQGVVLLLSLDEGSHDFFNVLDPRGFGYLLE